MSLCCIYDAAWNYPWLSLPVIMPTSYMIMPALCLLAPFGFPFFSPFINTKVVSSLQKGNICSKWNMQWAHCEHLIVYFIALGRLLVLASKSLIWTISSKWSRCALLILLFFSCDVEQRAGKCMHLTRSSGDSNLRLDSVDRSGIELCRICFPSGLVFTCRKDVIIVAYTINGLPE